jgi:hypothetical protein
MLTKNDSSCVYNSSTSKYHVAYVTIMSCDKYLVSKTAMLMMSYGKSLSSMNRISVRLDPALMFMQTESSRGFHFYIRLK